MAKNREKTIFPVLRRCPRPHACWWASAHLLRQVELPRLSSNSEMAGPIAFKFGATTFRRHCHQSWLIPERSSAISRGIEAEVLEHGEWVEMSLNFWLIKVYHDRSTKGCGQSSLRSCKRFWRKSQGETERAKTKFKKLFIFFVKWAISQK